MNIKKRSGAYELFNINKPRVALIEACKFMGTNEKDIDFLLERSNIQFFEGMSSDEIRDIFIQTANDISDLEHIQFDKIAVALTLAKIQSHIGRSASIYFENNVINRKVYRPELISDLTDTEFKTIMKHLDDNEVTNNKLLTKAGLDYIITKYMVLSKTGDFVETPQMMFMAIAVDGFRDYEDTLDGRTKVDLIIALYDALATFKVSLPSPEMANLRTNREAYASCITIEMDDTIDSWVEAKANVIKHTTADAGLGVDISNVASIGDKVKGGKIIHGGKIRLMKAIDADVQTSVQNNRRGSAAIYVNFFDPEIGQILSLKSPRTAVNQRINDLKYGIKINKIVFDYALQGKDLGLFSSRKQRKLHNLFNSPDLAGFKKEYDRLIEADEADGYISAKGFLEMFTTERFENGVYYPIYIDNMNIHKSYTEDIKQANLCIEFMSPTEPINSTDGGLSGVCVLSNINQGTVGLNELEHYTDLLVRLQNNIMKRQVHPSKAANRFVKEYASLGIGFSNHAYFLADRALKYGEPEALRATHEWVETFQYYLLKSSNDVAKQYGKCPAFYKTCYAKGKIPYQVAYGKDPFITNLDWIGLLISIVEHGLANTALSMIPPSETSSVVGSQISGVEPVRNLLTIKGSKSAPIKQYAPDALRLADEYDYAFDTPDITRRYLKHIGVIQWFIDMSISTQTFYSPKHYEDDLVPISVLISDMKFAHDIGVKGIYYNNTEIIDEESNKEEVQDTRVAVEDTTNESGCAGGSCSV